MEYEEESGTEGSVITDTEDNPQWILFNTIRQYRNSYGQQISDPFMKLPNKRYPFHWNFVVIVRKYVGRRPSAELTYKRHSLEIGKTRDVGKLGPESKWSNFVSFRLDVLLYSTVAMVVLAVAAVSSRVISTQWMGISKPQNSIAVLKLLKREVRYQKIW